MSVKSCYHIRPEHLNHHGSLYAGRILDWMCELAFAATVELRGRSDGIVMAGADGIRLLSPVRAGEVLVMEAQVAALGTTSITLLVQGKELTGGRLCCAGRCVFVTVDSNGNKTPHGLHSCPDSDPEGGCGSCLPHEPDRSGHNQK